MEEENRGKSNEPKDTIELMDSWTRTGKLFFLMMLICWILLATSQLVLTFYEPIDDSIGDPPKIGFTRTIYHYDRILLIADINNVTRMEYCQMIELDDVGEGDQNSNRLAKYGPTQNASFNTILSLMKECQSVDGKNLPKYESRKNLSDVSTLGFWKDTKWCRSETAAENYHDLGPNAQLDSCCRNVYLCPEKIKADESRYGLKNNYSHTTFHCDCTRDFYECSEKAANIPKQLAKRIYSRVLRDECLKDGRFITDVYG